MFKIDVKPDMLDALLDSQCWPSNVTVEFIRVEKPKVNVTIDAPHGSAPTASPMTKIQRIDSVPLHEQMESTSAAFMEKNL